MTNELKVEARREARLRRLLAKSGHRLQKTSPRHYLRADGIVGFMVVDANNLVAGGHLRDFELPLEQAEQFAAGLAA